MASGSGMKGAGTVGVAAWGLPGVELPGGLGGRVAGALCAEDCEGGVVGVAEALWAGASAVCDGAACEGGCRTTEVTNNRRKTGKRPSATRFKARGRDSICLKGSSAPGILLKAIPSLRPRGTRSSWLAGSQKQSGHVFNRASGKPLLAFACCYNAFAGVLVDLRIKCAL